MFEKLKEKLGGDDSGSRHRTKVSSLASGDDIPNHAEEHDVPYVPPPLYTPQSPYAFAPLSENTVGPQEPFVADTWVSEMALSENLTWSIFSQALRRAVSDTGITPMPYGGPGPEPRRLRVQVIADTDRRPLGRLNEVIAETGITVGQQHAFSAVSRRKKGQFAGGGSFEVNTIPAKGAGEWGPEDDARAKEADVMLVALWFTEPAVVPGYVPRYYYNDASGNQKPWDKIDKHLAMHRRVNGCPTVVLALDEFGNMRSFGNIIDQSEGFERLLQTAVSHFQASAYFQTEYRSPQVVVQSVRAAVLAAMTAQDKN